MCWPTTRPNITTDVISVYTCSKYIRGFLNEKRFAHISVSVFELKEYTLDRIGKKQMPICRICDPPQGFTNWTEFNANQVHRHGGQDKYKCQQALDRHMDVHKGKLLKCDIQGCTKSFSTCNYLRDHKNTVHGEPYECKHVLDGCKFKCKSHKTLLDHHKLLCPFNSDRSDVN